MAFPLFPLVAGALRTAGSALCRFAGPRGQIPLC